MSADGSVISSDPGFGIVQSGWFCNIRFPGPAAQCTNINGCEAKVSWTVNHGNGGTSDSGGLQSPGNLRSPILCALDTSGSPPDKAMITVNFSHITGALPDRETPINGEIKSLRPDQSNNEWIIDPAELAIDSPPIIGNDTTTITLKPLLGVSGKFLIKSPIYTIEFADLGGQPVPDALCQVTIEVITSEVTSVTSDSPKVWEGDSNTMTANGGPFLSGQPTWTASVGILSETTGPSITWTAPSNSGGTATIIASCGTGSIPKNISYYFPLVTGGGGGLHSRRFRYV